MCLTCFEKGTHPHSKDEVGPVTELESKVQDANEQNHPEEQCKDPIDNCTASIFHAKQCHNFHCKKLNRIEIKCVASQGMHSKLEDMHNLLAIGPFVP